MGVTGVYWQELLKSELQLGIERLQKRFKIGKEVK
jgi:hypothetical protein